MKSLFLCTIFATMLLSPRYATAQSIFPDKNLEAAVRRYVFEKRKNEEPIVEADVVNISQVVAKGKGIKDLTGLEKCRSLALIDFAGNEIEKIDAIKDLKNIQSLDLSKNKIKDITPIAGLTKLQYVKLSHNELGDISAIGKLENLRSLYLAHNVIKDLKPLTELTKRWAEKKDFQGKPAPGSPKIWSLYLNDNEIADISPIAGLKKLDSLDLSGNQVADISPLRELNAWKYLFLSNNKLTDLQLLVEMGKADQKSNFAPFWKVYLSGNPLSDAAKGAQLEELKKVTKSVEFK